MSEESSNPQEEIQQLKRKLAQRETELSIINSVQEGLAARLDVQEIYNLVGDKIREITDAQVVMISIYDRQSDTIEHRYAIEKSEHIIYPGTHPPGGFRKRIIETGEPCMVNSNVAEVAASLGQPTIPGTVTPKSWLGVPMFVGGQVSGVLSLQNIDHENVFHQSDIRLLQTLANAMSVALENTRLWEQEHLFRTALEHEFEIGRKIQAGFLPENIPQLKGWEITASLLPAREVAGDFYDVFNLPNGKIGLVIGDVCDKGLGAALFMTLFRSLLRAGSNYDFYTRTQTDNENSSEARLKKAILLTNNYIAETHGDTGMFATLFIGILDPHTGILNYINGGHLPPVLINQNGVKTTMTRTGPAVGVFADIEYEVRKICIEPGETLFCFTDGLTDSTNPEGVLIDSKKIMGLFNKGQALATVLDQIQEETRQFAVSANPVDDITLLAIKRLEK